MSDNIEKESSEFEVHDLGSLHNFRTEIPNIVFSLGLDAYELATYCIIKKTAGDKGSCFKSNSTLCEEIGCGETKLKEIKKSLTTPRKSLNGKALINITRRKNSALSNMPDLVQVCDIWPENMILIGTKAPIQAEPTLKKEKTKSKTCDVGGGGSPNDPGVGRQATEGGSPNDPKEEPFKKNPLEEPTNPTLPKSEDGLGSVGGFHKKANDEIKIHQCLQKIKIEHKDKVRLSKKFSEEIVSRSVTHCSKPGFVIKSSLDRSIFYFCQNPSHITETKEDLAAKKAKDEERKQESKQKNYYLADEVRKHLHQKCREIGVSIRHASDYIEIFNDRISEKVYYAEERFVSLVSHLIKKVGLEIPELLKGI